MLVFRSVRCLSTSEREGEQILPSTFNPTLHLRLPVVKQPLIDSCPSHNHSRETGALVLKEWLFGEQVLVNYCATSPRGVCHWQPPYIYIYIYIYMYTYTYIYTFKSFHKESIITLTKPETKSWMIYQTPSPDHRARNPPSYPLRHPHTIQERPESTEQMYTTTTTTMATPSLPLRYPQTSLERQKALNKAILVPLLTLLLLLATQERR